MIASPIASKSVVFQPSSTRKPIISALKSTLATGHGSCGLMSDAYFSRHDVTGSVQNG